MCDAAQGVCPCPPQCLGESQAYLSLQCGVCEACEECHRENSAPCPLPARKSAAELGFVKPLLCAAVRCGLTDSSVCRTPLGNFLPLHLPPTEQTLLPLALLCVLKGVDGTGGTAGIYGIRMTAGCCSAGSERWLLSQLLCCWLDPLASARCLFLLTYFHLLCPAHG